MYDYVNIYFIKFSEKKVFHHYNTYYEACEICSGKYERQLLNTLKI